MNSPDIAIVGMAGRFPGARSIGQLWENLCGAVEARTEFTDDQLLRSDIPQELLSDPNYVRARFVLEDIDCFDASFFEITPREAELTDPQFRIFTEVAWAALEDAAYDVQRIPGLVGVFAGASISTYLR